MKWLVTGGAGYIGSHVVLTLLKNGDEVVSVDSLVNGTQSRLPEQAKFYRADIRDLPTMEEIFSIEQPAGVIHLAGLKSVPDSFDNPQLYRDVNEISSFGLIDCSIRHKAEKFIFSSTAAVYDVNQVGKLSERSRIMPASPYGQSKLAVEDKLKEAFSKGLINGTSLRFFNVIGSANENLIDLTGDNLVPAAIRAIISGESPVVYGDDFQTIDGTGVRDFVDVRDIARAHLLAGKSGELPAVINIGTGEGHSVMQVIDNIRIILESDLEPIIKPRRKGDVSEVVASVELAQKSLGFEAEYSLSDSIISSIPITKSYHQK
jgi:UDP-glucose 4-epimerase